MENTLEIKLLNYAKAAYPVLVINTHEERRAVNDLKAIWAKREAAGKVLEWDTVRGLTEEDKQVDAKSPFADAEDALKYIFNEKRTDSKVLYIFKDFQNELESKIKYKKLVRQIKYLTSFLRSSGSMIIFIQPDMDIPVEWEKLAQLLDYALPDETAILNELNFIRENVENKLSSKIELDQDFITQAVDAAKGLSSTELSQSFSLAIITSKGKFDKQFIKTVFDEKIQSVKKEGLLTYIETNVKFDNIGGLEGIKSWINLRKNCFSKEARAYGLDYPKGALFCGMNGCGKTEMVKAIANEFQVPLFQLDIGNLFSKYVGSSEERVRNVIKVIESIGRCVIMIDEAEKCLSVSATSGAGDSGTGSRMLGTLLTWLSDREGQAFICMTSNNHTLIPPELIRRGRLDSSFWVDLPTAKEREEIFKVLLTRKGRNPKDFSITKLAATTPDFTGSEIMVLINASMLKAFNEKEEIADKHLNSEIKRFIPNAKMFPEKLAEMRRLAKGKLQVAGKDGEIEEFKIEIYNNLEIPNERN